jgi:hypothetical protein
MVIGNTFGHCKENSIASSFLLFLFYVKDQNSAFQKLLLLFFFRGISKVIRFSNLYDEGLDMCKSINSKRIKEFYVVLV